MPTSSQAMIVITTDEQYLRIPKRYFSNSIFDLPLETAGNHIQPSPIPKTDMQSEVIDDKFQLSKKEGVVQKTFDSIKSHLTEELKLKRQKSEGLEIVGLRKQHVTIRKLISDIKTTISKDKAESLTTPQDAKSHSLKVTITLPSANLCHCGDGITPNCPSGCMSVREQARSLLDELKVSISYDSRLLPSMELKKSLPPTSPNTVVFSLRNNDEYTHKEIMDLIKCKTGFSVRSVQFDPVNVRIGGSDIPSRWFVNLTSSDEIQHILQNGLEVNGEKIVVLLLDDLYKLEHTAYQLKMEEERKIKERNAFAFVPRKNRNFRASTNQEREAR